MVSLGNETITQSGNLLKNMKKGILILLLGVVLAACNADQVAIKDLEKFTQRMEQKSPNWSEADWDDAALQYNEICATLERYEYTEEQLRQIGVCEGKCTALFLKHSAANATRDLHNAVIEIGGAVDGFLQSIGK